MTTFRQWWNNDLSVGVKFVFLVLLANALPAITILMTLPHMTETMFVWTINPVINARLIGVMYANALILIAIGVFQTDWARVRIVMVVITLFSVFATILTFFFLKPFLAHPWFHLAYWLSMYLILFFAAPYVFFTHEKSYGGKLAVQIPLNGSARVLAGVLLVVDLIAAFALIFAIDAVNQFMPWTLPPLVGGLIGVLFSTHAVAYAWALWDSDWLRTRPIFWQAPLTALLLMLLPLLHPADLNPGSTGALTLYVILTGLVVVFGAAVIWRYRAVERFADYD